MFHNTVAVFIIAPLIKRLNYEVIKLDTEDFMKAAIKLYKDSGFVEIPEYRYNPHESARYFELVLKETGKPKTF